MKHQIIQSQWEQITEKQQQEWQIKISENHLPYISEMIEFLGDDWYKSLIKFEIIDLEKIDRGKKNTLRWICKGLKIKNLCNVLWEAVKHKLLDNGKQ